MLVAENNRASSVSTLHRAANVLDGDDDGLEDTDDDGGALLRTSGHPA